MTYLFVDTNVLLHYRRLEEIDWLTLSKSNEVVIVLCPSVIRELDQHKVNHPRNKFRKRAQEIITSLHAILSRVNPDVIRAGVRLEFVAEDPSLDFATHKLRSELPDDWLIASAIDWKQKHASEEIRIVSADLGISIKTKAQGILTLVPLEADKLADELDADEKRIRELQKELVEIKNSLPRLKLCFWGQPEEQNFLRFQIPPVLVLDEVKLEATLQQVRTQHPPHEMPDEAQERLTMRELEKQLRKGNLNFRIPIPKTEIQRFNDELKAFYQNYEAYLRRQHEHQSARKRMISFEVALQNTGTTPGEDIDIHMHFPDGFQLFNGDEALPPAPQPPKPPRQPGFVGGIDMSAIHGIGRMNPPMLAPAGPPPNISSPSIRRTNSYDVRSHVKKAKHGYTLRVAKFVAAFDKEASLSSFKVDYSISAANMPKASTDHLSVIIERGG